MYLNYYGLAREPFHITPDPDFLFLGPSHKEALGAMIYGVEQRKGFVAVTGEVGLGKTTVLRSFLDKLDEKSVRTVVVFNAAVSYEILLKVIYRELGLKPAAFDVPEMVHGLHEFLIEEYKQGRNVVLIIDEAQNMPVETLENLRMLSNLETAKDKLLQILLIGQPELESMLEKHELRQLRQRIAVRATLAPLSPKDGLDYIRHRIERSGGKLSAVFDRGALRRILAKSQGIPRKINIICDNALITGFGYMKKPVTGKIIREVVADLEGKKKRPLFRWFTSVLVVVGGLSALVVLNLPWAKGVFETVRKSLSRNAAPAVDPPSAGSAGSFSSSTDSVPDPSDTPSPAEPGGHPRSTILYRELPKMDRPAGMEGTVESESPVSSQASSALE